MNKACFAALGMGLLAACAEPRLEALTVPPATKVAALDPAEQVITLSRGTALGFACNYQGPCQGSATIGDGNLARVLPAYVDEQQPYYEGGVFHGYRPKSAYVLVGLVAGRTTLRVTAEDDAEVEYEVEILP